MIPDFAVLPPEVNSGLMYAGSGSGPMMTAASAWEMLAAELTAFVGRHTSVLSALHEHNWAGPSASAMAAAAAPYTAWAATTAVQAEQAATQARGVAAAYEAAFAMMVPPAVIETNRALLVTLVATNFFGQNTPAIAATEVAYAEMWAQDATAMYGYASTAVPAATTMKPFTTAPRTTKDDGGLGQHTAAVHAATETARNLTHTLSTAPNQSQGAALTPHSGPPGTPASNGMFYVNDWNSFSQLFKPFWGVANQDANLSVTVTDDGDAVGYVALTPRKAWLPEPALGLLGGKDPFLTNGHITTAVAPVGNAESVGALSVPRSWTTLARAVPPAGWSTSRPPAPISPAGTAGMATAAPVDAVAAGGGQPPVLTPLQISEPHYTGDAVYRDRENRRNFRMPRPAIGG